MKEKIRGNPSDITQPLSSQSRHAARKDNRILARVSLLFLNIGKVGVNPSTDGTD